MGKKKDAVIDLLEALKHQTSDLLANQILFNEMVENNIDGLVVLDDQNIIRFANQMAAKMFNAKNPKKLEGKMFGFSPVENETIEIEIAKDNKRSPVGMHCSRIEWEGQSALLVVLRSLSERRNLKESLQKASESLRVLINASPLAIVVMDFNGIVTLWSKEAERIFGWSELDVRGQPYPHQAQRGESPMQEVFYRVLSGENIAELEVKGMLGRNGEEKVVHVWATPLSNPSGLDNGVMLMVADITERKVQVKQMELALQNSEGRFRMALSGSPITVSSQDANLRYTWAYNSMAGVQAEEMLGHTDDELFPVDDAAPLLELKRGVLTDGLVRRDEVKIRHDGETYYYNISLEPVFDSANTPVGVACAAVDISALRRTEAQVAHAAHYDALTGLPNRALFRDRLQQAFTLTQREGIQSFAVLHFGLDKFKIVNQCLGRTIGDQLLLEVSRRLAEVMYEIDTVARVVGDEFLILVQNIQDSQDAALVAKKIIDSLLSPFMVEEQEIFLTASIGIAVYPQDGPAVDDMLKNADAALCRAKEELGRGNYQFFREDMNSRAMQKLILEGDLRRALEHGEFHLHYQPQVDIKTGKIIGLEALIRWAHPEKGNVPPDQFISAAESSGLIEPIGDWVLQAACHQHQDWIRAGLPAMRIAVNLSAHQFLHGDLVGKVAAAIEESGMDPHYLELELTESMLMDNIEETVSVLRDLKTMGVRLSIDDFGTGYSSLSYLKRFPLDILKIDRSFVIELAANADDAEIARAIIAMAHALRLEVVAEGVETEEQLDFLAAANCDFVQGYFFSPPVSAVSCARLLQEKSFGLIDMPIINSSAHGKSALIQEQAFH